MSLSIGGGGDLLSGIYLYFKAKGYTRAPVVKAFYFELPVIVLSVHGLLKPPHLLCGRSKRSAIKEASVKVRLAGWFVSAKPNGVKRSQRVVHAANGSACRHYSSAKDKSSDPHFFEFFLLALSLGLSASNRL
jgi:hypothetical protein